MYHATVFITIFCAAFLFCEISAKSWKNVGKKKEFKTQIVNSNKGYRTHKEHVYKIQQQEPKVIFEQQVPSHVVHVPKQVKNKHKTSVNKIVPNNVNPKGGSKFDYPQNVPKSSDSKGDKKVNHVMNKATKGGNKPGHVINRSTKVGNKPDHVINRASKGDNKPDHVIKKVQKRNTIPMCPSTYCAPIPSDCKIRNYDQQGNGDICETCPVNKCYIKPCINVRCAEVQDGCGKMTFGLDIWKRRCLSCPVDLCKVRSKVKEKLKDFLDHLKNNWGGNSEKREDNVYFSPKLLHLYVI